MKSLNEEKEHLMPLYYRNSVYKWFKLNPNNLPDCRCPLLYRITRKVLNKNKYICNKCFEFIHFQYDNLGYPTAAILRRID